MPGRGLGGTKLPPDDELARLVREGKTVGEIAALYSASRQGVDFRLNKAGIRRDVRPRQDHQHYIPWEGMRSNHRSLTNPFYRCLLLYSRRQQGVELKPADQAVLDLWLAYMDGDNGWRRKFAVHYDRDDDQGFWLEPWQEGDRDYVHPPAS